jgi:hypothetical protein
MSEVSKSRCLTSFLPYGPSGIGKTNLTADLSAYVQAESGKVVRLVSGSGGGWPVDVAAAVKKGWVKPMYIRGRANAIETLHRVVRGGWPSDPGDPSSPLLRVEEQKDWEEVGAYVFDNTSEIAQWLMDYCLGEEARTGIKMTAEKAVARFQDGDTFFASAALAHYGLVQNRMREVINRSMSLPGMIVVWPALEGEGKSDEEIPGFVTKGATIYGPSLIGNALNATMPSWFENTVHLALGLNTEGKLARRMYLNYHTLGGPIPYIAKTRSSKHFEMPPFLEGEDLALSKIMELLGGSMGIAEAKLEEKKNRLQAAMKARNGV